MLLYHSSDITRNGKFMPANIVYEYGAGLDASFMNLEHSALHLVAWRMTHPALHCGRRPDYSIITMVSITLLTFQAPVSS